jgi:MYXO-CTERM domain-containing protein
MKTNILSLFCAVATCTSLSAATYVYNNGSSSSANGITDSLGKAFRSGTTVGQAMTASGTYGNWTSAGPGVLNVGFFTTDNLSVLSKTALVAAFTPFGAAGTFGAGPSGQRGTFSLSPAAVTITDSVFSGKNMYFFAGNGSSFDNSTDFLVLKSSTLWANANDAVPTATTIGFAPGNTTLLLGTSVANVPTTNTDSTTTAGWQMVVVPEPSAALLGALGALGLLRRRRN